MKTKNSNPLSKQVHCKTLYTLHYPSDYADHIEKQRNRKLFLKLKNIEKKSRELREQMELLLKNHSLRLDKTQQLVTDTLDINMKFIQKKEEENQLKQSEGEF